MKRIISIELANFLDQFSRRLFEDSISRMIPKDKRRGHIRRSVFSLMRMLVIANIYA